MAAVQLARPAYQTVPLLVATYLLLFLPRALVTLRAGLAQIPPGVEEVAASLGLPPWRVFLRVSGRLLMPAAIAGGALVFLGVVNELTATLLLAPNGTRTLAMQFWTHTNDLDYAQAAPYAVLMVALSLPVTLILFRSARPGHGPMSDITLTGVSRAFGRVRAVEDVDLHVGAGERLAIVGPVRVGQDDAGPTHRGARDA